MPNEREMAEVTVGNIRFASWRLDKMQRKYLEVQGIEQGQGQMIQFILVHCLQKANKARRIFTLPIMWHPQSESSDHLLTFLHDTWLARYHSIYSES